MSKEEMTVADHIRVLLRKGEPSVLFQPGEMIGAFPLFNPASVRTAIRRMWERGELERIDRGLYQWISPPFSGFSYSKRIVDTHSQRPKHRYDMDIEMTIEGTADTSLDYDDIAKVLDPVLTDAASAELLLNGIVLPDLEMSFNVVGSERQQSWYDEYNPVWHVEVKMVNAQGSHYTFTREVGINESEFH